MGLIAWGKLPGVNFALGHHNGSLVVRWASEISLSSLVKDKQNNKLKALINLEYIHLYHCPVSFTLLRTSKLILLQSITDYRQYLANDVHNLLIRYEHCASIQQVIF